MPRRSLTDQDLKKYAKDVTYFRGVFMRDTLPTKPHINESGIVNLDDIKGPGTHWVAYKKRKKDVIYYDSFGDLQPPMELIQYFKGCKIRYNYVRQQNFNTVVCGHLCLNFLNDDNVI